MILLRILYALLATNLIVGSCAAQDQVQTYHVIGVSNEISGTQFKTGVQYTFLKPVWSISLGVQNNWTPSYSGSFQPFFGPHIEGTYRLFHRSNSAFSIGLGGNMNFRNVEIQNTGNEIGHQQLTTFPFLQYNYFKGNFILKINAGPAVQVNWAKNKTIDIKENHAIFTYCVRVVIGGVFPKL